MSYECMQKSLDTIACFVGKKYQFVKCIHLADINMDRRCLIFLTFAVFLVSSAAESTDYEDEESEEVEEAEEGGKV